MLSNEPKILEVLVKLKTIVKIPGQFGLTEPYNTNPHILTSKTGCHRTFSKYGRGKTR